MISHNPAQPRPHGMFHLLMHIGHLLEEHCRSGLAEYGLHHGQARVLMALDAREGLIQSQLAAGLGIAAPTLSLMLKKLLAGGLVRQSPVPGDERARQISLTKEGKSAVKKVRRVWGQAYETIMNAIADQDPKVLHGCLLSIRNALGGKTPEL